MKKKWGYFLIACCDSFQGGWIASHPDFISYKSLAFGLGCFIDESDCSHFSQEEEEEGTIKFLWRGYNRIRVTVLEDEKWHSFPVIQIMVKMREHQQPNHSPDPNLSKLCFGDCWPSKVKHSTMKVKLLIDKPTFLLAMSN